MDYRMRRFKQQLPENEAFDILRSATNGILSLCGPEGEPYGVPLSFALDGERAIYFHCARNGRKLDCIASDSRCSFCVVAQDKIVPEEFTTYFRSVIVTGRIAVVTSAEETLHALRVMCDKYSPDIDSREEIDKCLRAVTILRLDIESMTGKESIELTRNRRPSPSDNKN